MDVTLTYIYYREWNSVTRPVPYSELSSSEEEDDDEGRNPVIRYSSHLNLLRNHGPMAIPGPDEFINIGYPK